MMSKQQKLPQFPPGVLIMSATLLLLMIGFMMIFSSLVLYVTSYFHFTDNQAYDLSGAYNSLAFAIPLLGGFLGSRFLGYRFAVIASTLFSITGLIILSLGYVWALYLGLAIYVMGAGTSVPCLYVLLGRLYLKDDSRRDSGFTLSYIGMNIGAFIAAFSSGFIQEHLSFQTEFLLGALFSGVMLILFLSCQHRFTLNATDKLKPRQQQSKIRVPKSIQKQILGILLMLIAVPCIAVLLNHAAISNAILLTAGILSGILIATLALKEKGQTRNRMFAFLILTIISIGFWTMYMLVPSVLVLFYQHNVERLLFGMVIPTSSVVSLNPFFIVTLGPILSFIWLYLAKRGRIISTSAKFATGISLMGIGYLVLVLSVHSHNSLGLILFAWVILSYFFQTLGELFLAPAGYAMVGDLAPPRFEGLMMGIWQLATGLAGAISAFLARLSDTPKHAITPLATDPIYAHAFLMYSLIALIIAIIAIVLIPKIKSISGYANKLATAKAATID